jgi:hypothetical protein
MKERSIMHNAKAARALLALPFVASLIVAAGNGDALAMDKKSRDIALGVGLGLLTGAIASQGDPRGAIGGAVAGGLIGVAVSRDKQRHRREDWRDGDYRRPPHHHRGYQQRY